MSESGLSVGFVELQQEVGDLLGYGRTIANWNATQTTKVGVLVQAGVRRVYYPVGSNGYKWSFLRPTTNLYLGAAAADGVVSSTSFNSATFTNWVTQGIVAGTDTVDITAGTGPTLDEYDISVVQAASLTLGSVPGDGTSLTFVVSRPVANYNLPGSVEELLSENDVALYDIQEDPDEVNNLAIPDNPDYDDALLAAMNAKLNALIDAEIGEDKIILERPEDQE